MIDLDRALVELADRLEIPDGDLLVSGVVRRVREPARRQTSRRALYLAAAMVAVVAVTMVALPGPRHAVARWLGFDSVRIEPGATVPVTTVPVPTTTAPVSTGPATSATSTSTIVATTVAVPALDLGPSVPIDQAMSRTGLPNPAPLLLGDPQSAHVVQPPATGQIVVVYAPSNLVPQSPVTGVGALASVMPAKIEDGFFQKSLGDTATVRPVDVNGAQGYWIEGSPHQLFFQFGDEIQLDTLRLATNTLLWQRGDYVYRLEADIDLETALRIARSVP